MSDTLTRLKLGDREFILIGTAHISKESVEEVTSVIEEEMPDRVCVEIDASRYQNMKKKQDWSRLNISQVLKKKQGFLLLANLVLSSFQKKIGADLDIKPGEEMKLAVEKAQDLQIPFSLCDREISVTLRRAWAKSSFWGKNKLLAALLSSVFSNEKISKEDIEDMKKKNALESMMEELAGYMPSVKEVLIDERDQYLATNIYEAEGNKIVAVVGAGHVPGMVSWLKEIHEGKRDTDLQEISQIPPKSWVSKVLPWIIPAAVLGLIVTGFFRSGMEVSLNMMWYWVLVNGTLSAVGALAAFAHPVTILMSFLAAPITSLNPTIGVGIITGLIEAFVRKPRVRDFENLQDDILSVKGFFKNRLTHVLVVFFLSSLGSAIGTFIALPYLTSLLL
ncbi:MAG: TraB/GumN family protein [Spirochaetia bacterium]